MRETRKYRVFPSDLDLLSAFTALRDHMVRSRYTEAPTACDKTAHRVRVAEDRVLQTERFDEFLAILAKHPQPDSILSHSHWKAESLGDLACIVDVDSGSLSIVVESSDLNLLAGTHDVLRDLFRASNPPQERSPRLRKWKLKKSVFLAHRFDDTGHACANGLSRFLQRLGFQVVEGSGYEAREIPAKVEERIRAQDILICLVTPGDHHWLLSELSYARALGKYVIVLCEAGIDFNKGILGADFEYLPFPPGLVEKAFTDLLYALPS